MFDEVKETKVAIIDNFGANCPMRSSLTYLAFLTLGVLLGVFGFGFIRSSEGQSVLGVSLGLLAGLGLGSGLLAVFVRLWITRQAETWGSGRAADMYSDIIRAAEKPSELPTLLNSNRDRVANLGRLVLGFLLANQSIAYAAMALGGLVSIATLLTAYIQIERMEQQNALIKTQNILAEASRRASLNFEMTAILDQIVGLHDEPNEEIREIRDRLLIARIAAFSRALKPYRILDERGNLSRPLSPERGQLLIALEAAGLRVQGVIDAGAVFSDADLEGAKIELTGEWSETNERRKGSSVLALNGASLINALLIIEDIQHIDLERSDLRNAGIFIKNVESINFREATLPEANRFSKSVPEMNTSIAEWDFLNARPKDKYWLRDLVYFRTTHGDLARDPSITANPNVVERSVDQGPMTAPFKSPRNSRQGLVLSQPTDQSDADHWLRAYIPRKDYLNLFRFQIGKNEDELVIQLTDRAEENFDLEMTLASLPDFDLTRWGETVDALIIAPPERELGPGVRLLSDPLRTVLFEQFMKQGREFPRNPNFAGIFPGGSDVEPIRWTTANNTRADLTGAKFSHADLRYVDFGTALLNGTDFGFALMPDWKWFESSDFGGAHLANARAPKTWPVEEIAALGLEPVEDCETDGDRTRYFWEDDPNEVCHWILQKS